MNVTFLNESLAVRDNRSLVKELRMRNDGRYGGANAIINTLEGNDLHPKQTRKYPFSLCLGDGKYGKYFVMEHCICFSITHFIKKYRNTYIETLIMLWGLDDEGKLDGSFHKINNITPMSMENEVRMIAAKTRKILTKISRYSEEQLRDWFSGRVNFG